MNNKGIYHLFEGKKKAAKLFLDWCETSEELCEYDFERLKDALFFPIIDNLEEFIHLNTGNILDFLEENGYYISLPVRGEFKYVTVVHIKTILDNAVTSSTKLFSNSGVKSRVKAVYRGIEKSLEHLEKIHSNEG